MGLIEKLEKLRQEKGYTQKELAVMAGIPPTRYSKWKSNPHGQGGPNLKQGVALAKLLGVPPEFLADDEADEPETLFLNDDEKAILLVFRSLRLQNRKEAVIQAMSDISHGVKATGPGYSHGEPPDPRPGNGRVRG